MNLLKTVCFILVVTLLSGQVQASWFQNNSQKAKERAMCYSNYEERLSSVLIEKVPSIMEECGIGGLFDFCNKLGAFKKIFGSVLGCDGGPGGGSSNFCDWGFNKESAKEAWKIYRDSGEEAQGGNGRGGFNQNTEDNGQYASVDIKRKVAAQVLGLTL